VTYGAGNWGSTVLPISQDEVLARAVVSSKDARLSRNGVVPVRVFSYPGHFRISVDRFSKMTTAEAVQSGEHIAASRGTDRTFYGWALIEVTDAKQSGFEVEPTPKRNSPWHADILLPEQAAYDDDLHHEYAGALARRSKWEERPKL
jgi:hypothetical protein